MLSLAPERMAILEKTNCSLRSLLGHDNLTDAFAASEDLRFLLSVLVTGPSQQTKAAVLVLCDLVEWVSNSVEPEPQDLACFCRTQMAIRASRDLMDSDIVREAYPFMRHGYPVVDLERFCARVGFDNAKEALIKADQIESVLNAHALGFGMPSLQELQMVSDLQALIEYGGRSLGPKNDMISELVLKSGRVLLAIQEEWLRTKHRSTRKDPLVDVLTAFRNVCAYRGIEEVR